MDTVEQGIENGLVTVTPHVLQQIIASAVSTAATTQNNTSETSVQGSHRTHQNTPMQKATRPEIFSDMTEGGWEFFLGEWEMYKRTTGVCGNATIDQLLYTCTDSFRREMFNMHGKAMYNYDEETLLKHLKALAVRDTNRLVNRSILWSMKQGHDEAITAFISKLKGQAAICAYSLKCKDCESVNDYSLDIVTDQLIRGLANIEIQQEVLASGEKLSGHEQIVNFVVGKESGIRNQSYFTKSALNAQSAYRTQRKSDKLKNYVEQEEKRASVCRGCGSKTHGFGTSRPRKFHCPAMGKVCNKCQKPNHFASVCNSRTSEAQNNALVFKRDDEEWSAFMPTLSKESVPRCDTVNRVSHKEYSVDLGYVSRPPDDLPYIRPVISVDKDMCQAVSQRPAKALQYVKDTSTIAFTDTCAQTTASGTELLNALNFPRNMLIPTSHKIFTANNKELELLGAIFIELKYKDKVAKQMCYVSDQLKGLFLSKSACSQLQLIPEEFPERVGRISAVTSNVSKGTNKDKLASCGCLERSEPPQPPTTLPMSATAENLSKLQQWIVDTYKSSAFNTCPHQPLPMMHGPPLKIHLKDTKPVAVHTPIPVPLHWRDAVKADLDRDVALGVIEPVPIGTPTTWCSRAVYVAKKDGAPRRTVDFQALNAASTRQTHHTPSPFQQAATVPPKTKKTVLDAWNGYHSVKLHDDSKDLTTFITPWGRFRYCTTPQGYIAAGDAYTHRFDEIIKDFPRHTKCVDDSLLWDDSIESAFFHTVNFITLCSKNGIIFNPSKFEFAKDVVEFVGFCITENGMRPSQQMLSSIKNFPTPTNITGIRSWFGLVNQVSYAFSMADDMKPFRELLKQKQGFYWDETLETLFEKSKMEIVQKIEEGVRSYEVGRTTCIATDWSKEGIGFLLLQKYCNCPGRSPTCCRSGWKLVLAGSRFTTGAESRYAPVEGEALAVGYALEKSKYFVLGCEDLVIAVDHAPLVKILGDRKLEEIHNTRLFKLKERTLPFKYTIIHVPGKWHKGPDACSRYPSRDSSSSAGALTSSNMGSEKYIEEHQPLLTCMRNVNNHLGEEQDLEMLTQASVVAAFQSDSELKAITWERLKHATENDPKLKVVRDTIIHGIPQSKSSWPDTIQEYWKVREHLSVVDDIVVYRNRTVIPTSLRPEVLEILHSAHQGTVGMKNRARQSVYWPGLDAAIVQRRQQCISCNSNAPSQPAAPPTVASMPTYPFELTCSDYFTYAGKEYLIYVDRYSGWLSVMKCNNSDSRTLTDYLRTLFTTFGVPVEMASDGGPQYMSSATQQFLKAWGVRHRVSSVAFPHSNNRAELGVKTAKRLIRDNTGGRGELNNDRFARALAQYRNTPDQDVGLSPAQILFGRHLRDHMPVLPDQYRPRREWLMMAEDRERALAQRHAREVDRLSEHTKRLAPLMVGDCVVVQNQVGNFPGKWDKTGSVVEIREFDQYLVKFDGSGRCTLRNRRFLRKILPACRILHNPKMLSDQSVNHSDQSLTGRNNSPSQTQNPEPVVHNPKASTVIPTPQMGEINPPLSPSSMSMNQNNEAQYIQDKIGTSTVESHNPPLRRSTRERVPRKVISMSMSGKSHGSSNLSLLSGIITDPSCYSGSRRGGGDKQY